MAEKKKMDKKRPEFVRQDYHFRMRVHDYYWRRPRGHHSKVRRGEAGKGKMVQAGYRSPAELRGINLHGFRPIRVETLEQLKKINPKDEIAIAASNLGLKKKVQLAKFAAEKNITFANIKDAKKFVADAEAQMKARKEARKTAVEKKTKAEKKEEKKKEEKKEMKPKSQEMKTEATTHGDRTPSGSQTSPKAGVSR